MTPKEAFRSLLFSGNLDEDRIEGIVLVIQTLNELERLKKFKETFDNYILHLNERIKINKKIIEENFDLNPSLCRDLEVENTALEFALMLQVGPQNSTTTDTTSMTIEEVLNMLERRIIQVDEELSQQTYGSQMIRRAIEINLLDRTADSFTDRFDLTDIIPYTPEDVKDLIEAVTDESHKLAENLFDTMDLSEIESPIMEVFNERKK